MNRIKYFKTIRSINYNHNIYFPHKEYSVDDKLNLNILLIKIFKSNLFYCGPLFISGFIQFEKYWMDGKLFSGWATMISDKNYPQFKYLGNGKN